MFYLYLFNAILEIIFTVEILLIKNNVDYAHQCSTTNIFFGGYSFDFHFLKKKNCMEIIIIIIFFYFFFIFFLLLLFFFFLRFSARDTSSC